MALVPGRRGTPIVVSKWSLAGPDLMMMLAGAIQPS